MHSAKLVLSAVFLAIPLLLSTAALGYVTDDTIPEVTDRVARISFLSGDIQIRRSEGGNWESAALNLPIVEGDEIAANAGSRFEIQFNTYTFLRVAENSYLKIARLADDGIAISLPQGTLSLRSNKFEPEKAFFEIDAPKTTISVQKSGMYRVDSGQEGDSEIRITVADDGEARLYSGDSGFTLKSGRTAKLYIAGDLEGEWDTARTDRYADQFDTWALERDAVIEQRLKNSHYDQYYDRDIYGAEELNEYGEWIHTRKYGYVWRPYRNTISSYADWSPYRYGQWRWLAPFGWTWVNDEPWGWATYHHGRWIWDNGGWFWTPYGFYRNSRSWWRPALVVINVYNNNVCWYPLPYDYGYYNYNWNHRRRRHGGQWAGNGGPSSSPPPPSPTPPMSSTTADKPRRPRSTDAKLPLNGVVTVPANQFGQKISPRTATADIAKRMLSNVPDENQAPPILPAYNDVKVRTAKDTMAVQPRILGKRPDTRIGAVARNTDKPLDEELRKTRIFGNRQQIPGGEVKTVDQSAPRQRGTGAVGRPEKRTGETPPMIQTPLNDRTQPTPRIEQPRPKPRYEQPQPEPRYQQPEPTRRVEQPEPKPRYEPPTRSEPTPRYDPPPRKDPPQRNDPPPKSDPPPQKSEPDKPAPPVVERKGKDG